MILPPRLWTSDRAVIRSVDCHCAGLPSRIVVGGAPIPPLGEGATSMEKRQYMMDHTDWLRKLMLTEPRGYPCQNTNIIYESSDPRAAFGYVIGENNKIYPAMSGHNTICVVTALLETGMVPMTYPTTEFVLEAPAGLIEIRAECKDGKAEYVTFRNTASFSHLTEVTVDVPGGVGPVVADVAYGGMWYCIVDAASVGLELVPERGADIVRLGEMIKTACREQHPVQHPLIDYPGCDILAFRSPPRAPETNGAHSRNAVVMSTGQLDWGLPGTWKGNIDRSPCGTGTSAIMAQMHARGELRVGEDFVHESVLGTVFTGRIVEETTVSDGKGGEIQAIIPDITGQAYVTQYSEVVVDPADPFPEGYTVGDIWAS
eukprot:g4848.t1